MGTGPRSQSLRGPPRSYGKLQEPGGPPLRRALSLRQGREKPRPRPEDGGPEGPDAPGHETHRDTEQLIEARRGGSRRWLRQYQQQVRRRWESFVASIPSVTLSQRASPEPPLSTTHR